MTTDNTQNPAVPETTPTTQTTIKPETMMFVRQRDRYGLTMALVALVGVGIGFGLASFSRAEAPRSCDSHNAHNTDRAPAGAHIVFQDEGHTWHFGQADEDHQVRRRHHEDHGLRLGVVVDDHPQGARINSLVPGMPAEAHGLLVGDVIKRFDDQDITDAMHLVRTIKHTPRGETVTIVVDRDGQEITFEFALAH